MFCIYLRTKSDLCHLQHKLIDFYNRCMNWVFKWSSLHSVFKWLISMHHHFSGILNGVKKKSLMRKPCPSIHPSICPSPSISNSKCLLDIHKILQFFTNICKAGTSFVQLSKWKAHFLLRHQGPEHVPQMHCSLYAYCATLVPPVIFRHSHFHRQVPVHTTWEILAAKGELWARMLVGNFA